MASTVTSILSLTVGQWSGQVLGNASGSAVVRDPSTARVELLVDRSRGSWSLTMKSLSTSPVEVKVDAAWRPVGELTGAIRILRTTGEALTSRSITKDGGVITGQRIDPRSPDAFVRDRIVATLAPGQILVATGEVTPVAMLDLNGDGATDQADVAIVLGEWGFGHIAADVNRDGIVGPEDLAALLAAMVSHASSQEV